MNILLLGPERPKLINYLSSLGDTIANTKDPLTNEMLDGVDFIISYGYRYIIRKDVIDQFRNRAINLHISLLPWNRGADPNLWSFLEDTPKGVTIHLLDYGIDTGDILVQRQIFYEPHDTLRTSYQRLSDAIEELFIEYWPDIRSGNIKAKPQPPGGSFHRLKDKERYLHLLVDGWDTPVSLLIGKALTRKES